MNIALIVSSPMTARFFLQDQIRELAERHQVTLIANYRDPGELGDIPRSLQTASVDIRRQIAPLADLRALIALWRLFRKQRYTVIHSVTPKAGLLSMLAGFAARVPNRLHTFTGQVWVTKRGLSRRLLRLLDIAIFRLTTRCFIDSDSQRAFLIQMGVVTEERSSVLAHGSISGVDLKRFAPSPDARHHIRRQLAIGENAFVALYVGRLNRDKGIFDLVQAFADVREGDVESVLLLVGPDEGNMRKEIERLLEGRQQRVCFVGFTDRPEDYMNAADLFCLPSYREGFGSVVIEAAAVGIPALGSDIYGVSDAIQDGTTGVLHEPANIDEIRAQLERFRDDPDWRLALGKKAHERAERMFAKEIVTAALLAEYDELAGPTGQ